MLNKLKNKIISESTCPSLLSSGKLLFVPYSFEYATPLYSLYQAFPKNLKSNFKELPQMAQLYFFFCNKLQLQYRLYQMEPIFSLQCDMRQWNKITIQSLYRWWSSYMHIQPEVFWIWRLQWRRLPRFVTC